MQQTDLNCDMGEGIGNDEQIMPYISSANIACGYHAGDPQTMWSTVELAIKNGVAIGAHVSFLDREEFGRREMSLPVTEVYELVEQQLIILSEIINSFDGVLHHVKPHGALYNMAAKDAKLAKSIAAAIKDFDPSLILYGLSGSHSIREAEMIGLKTASEVFADRRYRDDGNLVPRSNDDALIETNDDVIAQVMQMLQKGSVTSRTGKTIALNAQTICIHGDGAHAVDFAFAVHEALVANNIQVKAPGQ